METYEVIIIDKDGHYIYREIETTNPLECMREARKLGDPVRLYYLGNLVWEKKRDA